MIRYQQNVIWLVYEERKCMERATIVHSYTATNLPGKKEGITPGKITRNVRTADLLKSYKKGCHSHQNSVSIEAEKAQSLN
jgi:hypothetical protein